MTIIMILETLFYRTRYANVIIGGLIQNDIIFTNYDYMEYVVLYTPSHSTKIYEIPVQSLSF